MELALEKSDTLGHAALTLQSADHNLCVGVYRYLRTYAREVQQGRHNACLQWWANYVSR